MKKTVLTIIVAFAAIGASAQHHEISNGIHAGFRMHHHHRHPSDLMILDVVYLKNGSEMVGMITEMIPGERVSLLTYDGSTHIYSFDEIIMTGKKYGRWSREYKRQIRQEGQFNKPRGYFGTAEFSTALMFTSENIKVGVTMVGGYRFRPQFALGLGSGVRLYAHDGEPTIPLFLHFRSDFYDRDKTPFIALNTGVQWSIGGGGHSGLICEPSFGYGINTAEAKRINFSVGFAIDMYDDISYDFDLGINLKFGYSF